MQLLNTNITQTLDEHYLLETLNLDNKTILELGCGKATMTQKIANTGYNRKIIATEVDETQHQQNLLLDLCNVNFIYAGAEKIPCEDNSIDIVMMFKSFHHIPKESLTQALFEIKRVLKPNGLAYISEPLYQGEQNQLISIFHDEKQVREDAFNALKAFVDKNEMKLFKEIFFQTPISYTSFSQFEENQINVTYNDKVSDETLRQEVKQCYESMSNEQGEAHFMKPFRVDILQKL